jgi:hypothetical protein
MRSRRRSVPPHVAMSAQLAAALDLILDRLGRLKATGEAGFEGFMRDVLIEVTGMPFHLAKSGPQGGR